MEFAKLATFVIVRRADGLPLPMKLSSDEITDYQSAAVLGDDGQYHTAWTLAKGEVTDKLTVHYYDWDRVYIGTIVFRAE